MRHALHAVSLSEDASRERQREREMIDNLDGLILLLLRTSGTEDAILTYQEETGASHAEATGAVSELARRNGLDQSNRARRKRRVALATAVTVGVAGLLVLAWPK